MGIEFKYAPEAALVGAKLINSVEEHGHLAEAKIEYLIRTGPWPDGKGGEKMASAQKGKAMIDCLADREIDFVITINAKYWDRLSPANRAALIDHELSHCIKKGEDGEGAPIWGITGHTVEEFSGVIARHGLWRQNLEGFAEAVRQADHQMTLGDLEREIKKAAPDLEREIERVVPGVKAEIRVLSPDRRAVS